MAPCFFHAATEPLFGLYGPPQGDIEREHAVLLAAPVGHEYVRSHWRMRLLADHLLRSGYHVFRFDYSFQGDSWGDFERARMSRWIEDIRTAFTELEDNAGVSQLSIVGHRLGASLAFLAANEIAVRNLVLWDPIVNGKAYVESLRSMQGQLQPAQTNAPLENLLGYRYSAALRAELGEIDMFGSPRPNAQHISFLHSDRDAAAGKLRESWPDSRFLACDATDWNDVASYAEPLPLGDAGRQIAALLEGGGS